MLIIKGDNSGTMARVLSIVYCLLDELVGGLFSKMPASRA